MVLSDEWGVSRRRTLCCKIIFHEKSNITKKALPWTGMKLFSLRTQRWIQMYWRFYWDQEPESWLQKQFRVNWQSFFPSIRIWQIIKEGHWWFVMQWLPVQKRANDGHRRLWSRFQRLRNRDGQVIHFRSALLPPYIKRTYPGFISKKSHNRWFSEALATLLGKDAKGISAETISRLK